MTHSLHITRTKNGFTLMQATETGSATWSYEGDSEEKVNEILTRAKELLLEGPDEIPLPGLVATLEHPTN